jgi:hypothetical protein
MAFNWGEYLTFAKNLYEKQDIDGITCSREAVDRCIVSRAYYAAFHHAKKYAEMNLHKPFPRDNVHQHVGNWFRNNNKNGIANDLREFSRWRTDCDYDDDVTDLHIKIRSSIKSAGRIIYALSLN